MLRRAAEFQNVPLGNAHVLKQRPCRMRKVGDLGGGELHGPVLHRTVKINVSAPATKQVEQMITQRLVGRCCGASGLDRNILLARSLLRFRCHFLFRHNHLVDSHIGGPYAVGLTIIADAPAIVNPPAPLALSRARQPLALRLYRRVQCRARRAAWAARPYRRQRKSLPCACRDSTSV